MRTSVARLAPCRAARVLVGPRRTAAARRLARVWVERARRTARRSARAHRAVHPRTAYNAVRLRRHHRQRRVLVGAAWTGKWRRRTPNTKVARAARVALRSTAAVLVAPRCAARARRAAVRSGARPGSARRRCDCPLDACRPRGARVALCLPTQRLEATRRATRAHSAPRRRDAARFARRRHRRSRAARCAGRALCAVRRRRQVGRVAVSACITQQCR